MLKKTITYQDLDGNDVTEDFYFNLSKAEIAEMELGHEGGWSTYLENLIKDPQNRGAEVIAAFKGILLSAIGRRSEDGKRFIKNDEIRDEFVQSDAYSTLFMELIMDGEAAAEFVNGIIPSDISEIAAQIEGGSTQAKDDRPAYIRENREPTKKELSEMSREELQQAFRHRAQLRSVE